MRDTNNTNVPKNKDGEDLYGQGLFGIQSDLVVVDARDKGICNMGLWVRLNQSSRQRMQVFYHGGIVQCNV